MAVVGNVRATACLVPRSALLLVESLELDVSVVITITTSR